VDRRQRRRGVPGPLGTVFQTVVATLTLVMVFVIQHTQARQQRTTQRKLDEILQAIPGADNSLLTFEHASDDELSAAAGQYRDIRRAALDDPSAHGTGWPPRPAWLSRS
jgi:low affinity Fe/Cu permease